MRDLLTSLRAWGAKIECLEQEDCLPLRIHANSELQGGTICVQGAISSQFMSALLMLAPFSRDAVEIAVQGELVSSSYVAMTLYLVQKFGVRVESASTRHYRFPGRQGYLGQQYQIPTDASSASYFFALAAISGRGIIVDGLGLEPLQSDLGFVHLLEQMGCRVYCHENSVAVCGVPSLRGLDVDMCDMSDVVPSLAIVALFAQGPTHIRHVAHMRHKECDRIAALCCELRKLGAKVEEFPDGLRIAPLEGMRDPNVYMNTYDDHRMAMAFAVLSQRLLSLKIEDPSCVAKTYPNFFQDLEFIQSLANS